MSIVSLQQVSLQIANRTLLKQVDWQIHPKERIALVGRNGAGKSTLLRLLQGELTPDSGKVQRLSNLSITGLTQSVPTGMNESVYHFLAQSLGELGTILARFHHLSQGDGCLEELAQCQQQLDTLNGWEYMPKIELMASRLKLDINACMKDLSGGMIRRVLLAAALIASPDLLLLDEPTNHLDIASIEWLEVYLRSYPGSVVVVTHDRTFLNQVATKIIEIDRGRLIPFDCNYEQYLDRREALRQAEQKQDALFDKKLAQEEVWIRTGVKARRTRNEGRVRALKALRETWKKRRSEQGKVQGVQVDGGRSGQDVIEAKEITFQYDAQTLIKPLSLLLARKDKLGIIGPNGCGKTTLIRLLLGELPLCSGTLKQGTGIQVAYFDQLRGKLDEDSTVMSNVADGADHVTINGKQKHVTSYLKDFLFSAERFNQKVSTLSGGEKNRLLLAKLLVKPVNLLVLDEPTNDLDIETLELLETMLVDYQGTLILISHDRAFINEVVTSVLVYEDDGVFREFVGGYDDYLRVKKEQPKESKSAVKKERQPQKTTNTLTKPVVKLSFNEQRELQKIPAKIDALEGRMATLQASMAKVGYYQQDATILAKDKAALELLESNLEQLYARWEILDNKD